MDVLAELTPALRESRELTPDEVDRAAAALAGPETAEGVKAEFLAALARKGESAAEIAAFARAFRTRAIDPGVAAWAPQAIDIVGTGGDHAGGFNISSVVVLVLAAAGVPVMKHGNRGITSRSGSADLLAALGIRIDLPPAEAKSALRELGFVFFFAPAYHPAFKHIGPVRKALAARGQRTVFNLLGPLLNPGRPAHVLLGVFADAWVERLAAALDALGAAAGLAVHGRIGPQAGIDELTTATENRVRGAGRLRMVDAVWQPEELGFERAPFADLLGGDVAANAAAVESILAGKGPRGLVDTIVLNAAAGLWICGRTGSIAEGAGEARELLLGGAVRRKLDAAREFYGAHPSQ